MVVFGKVLSSEVFTMKNSKPCTVLKVLETRGQVSLLTLRDYENRQWDVGKDVELDVEGRGYITGGTAQISWVISRQQMFAMPALKVAGAGVKV